MERELYAERLSVVLREWDARIDELRAKAEFAPLDSRIQLKETALELAERRKEGARLLNRLREDTGEKWEEARRQAESVIEEWERSLKKAA